jgi:hypothetical protein
LTGSPKTIPVCKPPKPFKIEPFSDSVFYDDPENPANVTFITHAEPTGTQGIGVQATATRHFTLIRANGVRSVFQPDAVTTQRFKNPNVQYTDSFPTGVLLAGDRLCVHLTISSVYSGLADNTGTVTSVTDNDKDSTENNGGNETCVAIADKPYLKVYGNDVIAGGAFGSGVCGTAGHTIKTYARNVTTGDPADFGYHGSSVEYAAFAMAAIDGDTTSKGFFSAALRTTDPQPATGLTFANSAASGLWGGNFGALTRCIPDYYNDTQKNPALLTVFDVSALADGQYKFSSGGTPVDLTASGPIAGRKTVYIKGDVYLNWAGGSSRGFTYTPTGWASVDTIPSCSLIVKGQNYID